jgi:hypothetical protein
MSVKAWPKTQLKNAEKCEGLFRLAESVGQKDGNYLKFERCRRHRTPNVQWDGAERNVMFKTNGFLCSDSLGTTLSNLLVNLVIMHASKFLPQLFSLWARAARKQGYSRIQPDTVK